MNHFVFSVEKEVEENKNFRRVLYTGAHSQLAAMSLKPGEDIGEEAHGELDQFLFIVEGKGKVVLDGAEHQVDDDSVIIVPAGVKHNVLNTSQEDLKLYTIYAPAEHRDGLIHKTKADALTDDSHANA